MEHPIITIKLQNELDVVLAYKRTMQLSELTGFPLASQTKFATAVSEICRNVIEHVGEGLIRFSILQDRGALYLEAHIKDRGRGIPNLPDLLDRHYVPTGGKGQGLFSSRKLVDVFRIESDFQQGTRVWLHKRVPANHPPINAAIIQGWSDHFNIEPAISPYAEIKRQNMQMIELMEQLRVRTIEAEYQLQEIRHLNQELQSSHHEVTTLLQERESKNLQLEKANKALDDFAHTVTHDLKSPLNNILGLVEAVTDYLKEDDQAQAQKVLPMIQLQIKRMDSLIRDVLAYSLTGRQQIQKQDVDLRELVQSILATLALPKGFTVTLDQHLPVLHTERVYLQQIFSNLLSNAVKYHDQETGNIWVKAQPHPTHWEFIVADDGPGILAENQKKIFDLFETSHDVNHPDSTGIGLAIVRKIVEEMGGKVWVASEGRGSSMHFTWSVDPVKSL